MLWSVRTTEREGAVTQNIAEAIIRDEANDVRFENFCRELCARNDGITLLPTSKTYDQARDAKSFDPSLKAYVGATHDKEIESKIDGDSKHLAVTSAPLRITYCVGFPLSEAKIDALESRIRANVPTATAVRVLSARQLAALATQHVDLIERYYLAELRAIEAMLKRVEDGAPRADEDALKLALLTMGTEDARQLREEIGQYAVLQVLVRASKPLTVERVAERIASDLRIPASIHPALIQTLLDQLTRRDLTVQRIDGWELTEAGQREASTIPAETAQQVLQGARVVQSALQELTGYHFTEEQFTHLWSTFLDYLAELFHAKGLAVICAINDVLSDTAKTTAPLEKFATAGAAKIRASSTIPEMGEAIEQAVVDIFTERSGPAFEWLAKVCERFVALCALGLEITSAEEIRKIISRHRIVLDSDIVITFLCQGERGHGSMREVIARWQRLGGKILLAQQVLEEVAYHAYVSDREFKAVRQLGPVLKGTDVRRYCGNAFVRAFFTVDADPSHWSSFRDQYAGTKAHDYTKIVEVLRDELLFESLPAEFDKDLARDITAYLRGISSDTDQMETAYFGDLGRLGRDGQLLATIAQTREAERASLNDARIMVLSSSMRLRRADERFRERLGSPEAVISRAAVSYLIALIPDAGLGAASLRKALFEFGEAAHFTDTERFALNIIKSSGTVIMPWTQRSALRRQIETHLRREAERADAPLKQIRMDFIAGKDPDATAQIIANAVSDLALKDPERVRLQRDLAETKKQLEAATARAKPARQPRRTRRKKRK